MKYLSSKVYNSGFKIDLIPSDSAAIVTCSLNSSHPITIEDLLIGDRIENASISANGDYAIITGRIVFKDGNNEYYKKLYDIRKSTFIGDVSNKKDINWMPSSNKYYYTKKDVEGTNIIVGTPENNVKSILAQNMPDGYFRWTPDEKTLIFSINESPDIKESDVQRLF